MPAKTTVATFLVGEWLPAIRASNRPSTHDHYWGAAGLAIRRTELSHPARGRRK
jgi:hypothetical protein